MQDRDDDDEEDETFRGEKDVKKAMDFEPRFDVRCVGTMPFSM